MKHFVSRLLVSCAVSAVALGAVSASAKDLKSVGVTVVDLGNPFFGAIAKSIEAKVKAVAPDAKTLVVSGDYDLGKQSNQFDNFIQAGVDLILVPAIDSKAIAASITRVTISLGVPAGNAKPRLEPTTMS